MGQFDFLANPQGVQLPDPAQGLQRAMTLQQLSRQNQAGDMDLEQRKRQQAAMEALNRVLPQVAAGGYSPESINAALQAAPESAGLLLDMLDKKRQSEGTYAKTQADARKSNTEADSKAFQDIANVAYGESQQKQPSLNRIKAVADFYKVPLPAFSGDPSDPQAAQAYVSSIANAGFAVKDQVAAKAGDRKFTADEAERMWRQQFDTGTQKETALRDKNTNAYQQGQLANQGARLAWDKENANKPTIQTDAEGNMFAVNAGNATGRPVTLADGTPMNKGGKPLTEVQGNAAAFGMRAKAANDVINTMEAQGSNLANPAMKLAESNWTNWMAPTQAQEARQAKLNFMSATLRKESGAAINASEYDAEDKKYFPQVGDSREVIAQKRQARDLAIRALGVQAGKQGAKVIDSATMQPGGESAPTSGWSAKRL